jgi:hypothetical protein
VQVSVKVVVAVKAPVEVLPLVLWPPFHPPEAVQAVALVALQVSVEEPPLGMVVGLAVSVTAGAGMTVTVAVCVAGPPGPVQVSV